MQHKFKIDVSMTSNIDAETAKNILIAAVERETGKQVSDIEIKIKDNELTGFYIKFDPESHKPQTKTTKGFVPIDFGILTFGS